MAKVGVIQKLQNSVIRRGVFLLPG